MAKARPKATVVPAPRHWSETEYTPGPVVGSPLVDHWPIPKHCTYIWLSGDAKRGIVQPRLGFPPSVGHAHGHSVALPLPSGLEAKAAAWDLLMKILSERQGLEAEAKIGQQGAPTQVILDAYAAALARGTRIDRIAAGVTGEKVRKADELAAKIGLNVDDLELDL